MKIAKIFNVIAFALGLIYSATVGYLACLQIQLLGSGFVLVDGGYSLKWKGIVPEAIPALVCLIATLVGFAMLIWSFLCPSLILQILSAIFTVASAVILAIIDINSELSALFYGMISSIEGLFAVKTVIVALALVSQVVMLTPSIYLINKRKE